ncbi:hypothetical protein GCK32_019899 [Trichostrongylus colubriformis]|uniref:Uncharacterized protein n=1 Tax=Trichostrongylus colubriformis TaxID=6319 RepID=A0AAN8IQP7_TRICO
MPRLIPIIRLLLLLVFIDRVVSLGGKSFVSNHRTNLAKKNYALLSVCHLEEKTPLNVSLFLNPLQQNEVIKFHQAGVAFEISSRIQNVTQVAVEAAPWPVSQNIMQITFRLGKRLYKLHFKPNCESDETYWTVPDTTSFWGRFIDCDEPDTFCDSRVDEISDCDRLFTYHVFWRNGIDRYK